MDRLHRLMGIVLWITRYPQDKSQRLGVLSLREERRTLRLRRLYHVRATWMLADMLTKATGVDPRSLLDTMIILSIVALAAIGFVVGIKEMITDLSKLRRAKV